MGLMQERQSQIHQTLLSILPVLLVGLQMCYQRVKIRISHHQDFNNCHSHRVSCRVRGPKTIRRYDNQTEIKKEWFERLKINKITGM